MNKLIKKGVSIFVVLGLVIGSMSGVYAEPSDWVYDGAYWARTEGVFPQELLVSNMDTAQLTREQLAEILVYVYAKTNGVSVEALPSGDPFTDTDSVYVGKAYQAGLMPGMTDVSFYPNVVVSRMTVIQSVKDLLTIKGIGFTQTYTAVYSDISQVNTNDRAVVNYLYGLGALSGFANTELSPSLPATVEMTLSLMMNVLKTHNWMDVPVLELVTERKDKNGFTVPIRTATVLSIYQPEELNGIRLYYTGLGLTSGQDNVDKSHRQIVAVAERYPAYSYTAVRVLTDVLEDAWDEVRKRYEVESMVYINGTTGAVSSEAIFTSNYIQIYTGNRLMVDFVK